MSRLNLEINEQTLFGQYLPTVFIEKVQIRYGISPTTGVQNPTANIQFLTNLTLNITRPSNTGVDIYEWVKSEFRNLSLYTFLSPFQILNTNLENSTLSMRDMYDALQSGNQDPHTFNSKSIGWSSISAYIKDSFINDWHGSDGFALTAYTQGPDPELPWNDTTRRNGLFDANIGKQLWGENEDGSLNTEGPWDVDDPDCYFAEVLSYAIESFGIGDYSNEASKYFRIPLKDIITLSSSDYAGSISNVSYDDKGNEIIEISGIPVMFEFATAKNDESVSDEAALSLLLSVPKLFLIATVGSSDVYQKFSGVSSKLFDSNFGNISYETVLMSGAPPPQEETIYVKISNEEVCNDTPIQARNQKYYEPSPVKQSVIVESLQTLISNFSVYKEKDSRLAQNIANLELILATKHTSAALVPLLFRYGASYVGKDRASPAGNFYSAFSEVLVSYNEAIVLQEQLSKVLVLNDRVIDLRPTLGQSISYVIPTPLGADYLTPGDWLLKDHGDDYVPSKWTLMSRYVEATIPTAGLLSDFAEFAIGEGYGVTDALAGMGADIFMEDLRVGTITGDDAFAGTIEGMPADGLGTINVMSDQVVANKGFWMFDYEKALHLRSNLAQVVNIKRIQDLFHMTVPYGYFRAEHARMKRREFELQLQNDPDSDGSSWQTDDYVDIRLTCHFDTNARFPDTTSCSYSYDPQKMKYGQPFVTTFSNIPTSLSEDDLPIIGFAHGLESVAADVSSDEEYTDALMAGLGYSEADGWRESQFSDAITAIFKDTNEFGDTLRVEDMVTTFQDMLMMADANQSEYRANSFLRHQVIDVAKPKTGQLLNFNPFPDFDDAMASDDASGIYTAFDDRGGTGSGYGPSPVGGYRLLSFEYRDYMDDDVAYYNTYGSYEGKRNITTVSPFEMMRDSTYVPSTSLYGKSEKNPDDFEWGDPQAAMEIWTNYELEVKIQDLTMKWFTQDVVSLWKESFNRLLQYQSQAKQFCSENNITGRFTSFFIDGVVAFYDERGEDYPWVEAAWMYHAVRDLILGSYSGPRANRTDIEKIMEAAKKDAARLHPQQASMDLIDSFVELFRKLLTVVDPAFGGGVYYYPVYERMANVLGVEYEAPTGTDLGGGDATLDNTYNNIMYSDYTTCTFTNTIKINGYIYGNLSLAAFWDDSMTDAPGTHCIEDAIPEVGATLPSVKTPAGWMDCIWPTYTSMRLGLGIGDAVDPGYLIADVFTLSMMYLFGEVTEAGFEDFAASLGASPEEIEAFGDMGEAIGSFAGMAFTSIYWQESVVAQAFINEFRDELDALVEGLTPDPSIPDDFNVYKPKGHYLTGYHSGAWYWPPPMGGFFEYIGGPDPSNFIECLEQLGVRNIWHQRVLALGWQTLHVGGPMQDVSDEMSIDPSASLIDIYAGEAFEFAEGFGDLQDYDTGVGGYDQYITAEERDAGNFGLNEFNPLHAFAAELLPPIPMPAKFGFLPKSLANPNNPGDWPRTRSPEVYEGFLASSHFGRKLNKLIYCPDTRWDWFDHLGPLNMHATAAHDGDHSLYPLFYGLGVYSNNTSDSGPVRDASGDGYETYQGVVFEQGIGFVDKGLPSNNIVGYATRLPRTQEEIDTIITSFLETGYFSSPS